MTVTVDQVQGVSVIVLTTGDRPVEVANALTSVDTQSGVSSESILVRNGGPPIEFNVDIDLALERNIGVPGGRNHGARHARMPLLCFLDDDATLIDDDVLAKASTRFNQSSALAVIGLRIVDGDGNTRRRHHPRLLRSVERSGPVTSFPGGACVIRKDAFLEVGGFCEDFVFALEETDLAWRLIDAGWRIDYGADLLAYHPPTAADRRSDVAERTARNRVWLARRNLPWPVGAVYVLTWLAIGIIRSRLAPKRIAALIRGTCAGLSGRGGYRHPIRWLTVGRLTRLGRPPII
jgi:hypothetical protein